MVMDKQNWISLFPLSTNLGLPPYSQRYFALTGKVPLASPAVQEHIAMRGQNILLAPVPPDCETPCKIKSIHVFDCQLFYPPIAWLLVKDVFTNILFRLYPRIYFYMDLLYGLWSRIYLSMDLFMYLRKLSIIYWIYLS